MKKIITAIILLLLSATPVGAQSGALEVDFGDPPVGPEEPIFTVENMLPGDEEEREIKVTNTGDSSIPVILYSDKTEEAITNWPTAPDGDEFSQLLELEILEGSTIIYGTTSLDQFFQDSSAGLSLGQLSPNEDKTFRVRVKFPSSAGNEYQLAKVVYDLMFEQFQVGGLVINEVFYDPDEEHGSDCSADSCGDVDAEISGNASGSTNIIDIKFGNTCLVLQTNTANINNSINSDTDTGNNTVSNNTGSTSLFTGSISSFFSIFNTFNFSFGSCDSVPDKNDEWIELYNASSQTIELNGWILQDNSGQQVVLDTNEELEPGQFALISRSLTTWDFWDEDPDAVKIAIGTDCGNGLENDGDHLYLFDPNNVEADFVAWGNDTERWNPSVPDVDTGHSIERSSPGLDSDTINDWIDRFPPTPGG